jgi:hypothetical protein
MEQELVDWLADEADRWEEEAREARYILARYAIAILSLLDEEEGGGSNPYRWTTPAITDSIKRSFDETGASPDVSGRLQRIGDSYPSASLGEDKLSAVSDRLDSSVERASAMVRQRIQEARLSRSDDLADALEEALVKAIEATIREYSSTLSMVDRAVLSTVEADYFQYLGPEDEKNRPFCSDIVTRTEVFTAEGIEELNNHPLLGDYVPPNVRVWCGGYNCRHVWAPTSRLPDGWTVNDGEG